MFRSGILTITCRYTLWALPVGADGSPGGCGPPGWPPRHRRRRHLTTIPAPRTAARPDLLVRDFQPDPAALDARWCGDMTYIPTDEGWLYLVTVIDIAARGVVGWAIADHMHTGLVAGALTAACRQRRPRRRVIFHPDRGSQYTSRQCASLAEEFGVRLPVGPHRAVLGQRARRIVLRHHQRKLLDTAAWPSRTAARTAIFDFIEGWYNLHRVHSSLGYSSPPTTRPHSQPDHHTNDVRQSGTRSGLPPAALAPHSDTRHDRPSVHRHTRHRPDVITVHLPRQDPAHHGRTGTPEFGRSLGSLHRHPPHPR